MERYIVEVNNEILGNSRHVMTQAQIKEFNVCAYRLSKLVDVAGGTHTSGMWSVRKVKKGELYAKS